MPGRPFFLSRRLVYCATKRPTTVVTFAGWMMSPPLADPLVLPVPFWRFNVPRKLVGAWKLTPPVDPPVELLDGANVRDSVQSCPTV